MGNENNKGCVRQEVVKFLTHISYFVHMMYQFICYRKDNEMTCLGFSISPAPTNSAYDTSPELYMYRAYNGATYSKGVAGKTIGKFHENDVVTFLAGILIMKSTVIIDI